MNLASLLKNLVWQSRKLVWLTLLLTLGLGYAATPGDTVFIDGANLDTILDQITTEIARQLQTGTSLLDVLTSPVILASLIGVLAGFSNYYLTQTVKSYTRLKGAGTRILAMFFSVVLGGGLGYLGLLEGADASGGAGAWAGLSLLIAWTIGEAKHENKELKRTGLRKVDRAELSRENKAGLVDIAIEGLVAAAAPLGIPAATIRAMYEMFGREAVLKLIAGTRALTQAEINFDQDNFEKGASNAPTS